MTGYLVNFAIYTMAMLGLIFFALMIYKKFAMGGMTMKYSKNRKLHIEETLTLGPRKNLYIVKADNERFLIAGDVDKTTLISKLETNTAITGNTDIQTWTGEEKLISKEFQTNRYQFANHSNREEDFQAVYSAPERNEQNSNVLHDMLKKINR